MKSVSYTHLDVYKRQVCDFARRFGYFYVIKEFTKKKIYIYLHRFTITPPDIIAKYTDNVDSSCTVRVSYMTLGSATFDQHRQRPHESRVACCYSSSRRQLGNYLAPMCTRQTRLSSTCVVYLHPYAIIPELH